MVSVAVIQSKKQKKSADADFFCYLIRIETKNNSATIGTWRSSYRDNYFESGLISVFICNSCIDYISRFIDIRYRSKNAYIIIKRCTDKDMPRTSHKQSRGRITCLEIDAG
jgi:hypothetical protein